MAPRAPALGAGNHTGLAAMNESKEEGCRIAVGPLQVSCSDHRQRLRSIYGLHFPRLRRGRGENRLVRHAFHLHLISLKIPRY